LLTRPSLQEILKWREHVDQRITELFFDRSSEEVFQRFASLVLLGINHEQQHQELLLTDIQHLFSLNPLYPTFVDGLLRIVRKQMDHDACSRDMKFSWFASSIYSIGSNGDIHFSFDNEGPEHTVYLDEFAIGCRLVTNREFMEFIEDGGYRDPLLWLSDGWAYVGREGWEAPLYWTPRDSEWYSFTLRGLLPLNSDAPVCYVSYYEADAYAKWCGLRLPREEEWEVAARELPLSGTFLESTVFEPLPIVSLSPSPREWPILQQMFGDAWEWTMSPYVPYPGFRPVKGPLGEYNGKFMCNQQVLRGGSCFTPASHIRLTYRNFFSPSARWQCAGIRLAKDPD